MSEERNIKINIDSNAKEVARDTNALGASIENATNSTAENNQEVAKGNESYKTFKTQLREANAELQKQIQLTGESSKETIKAAKSVADLKDQMQFASDLSDKFNPDQKFKALGAATQIAGTGLQGVTAGMALFGGESADTQKQLLKVQAAMAFSDAISNLSNLGDQWNLLKATISGSTLATKANTAATGLAAIVQNAFTGSVATTSTGFKVLKIAIAATGIGLLVVGVGLLVTNFDKLTKFANSFEWMRKVGGYISNIVNSITDFVGVTSEAGRLLDKQKEFADKSIKQNERYLERNASTISAARKREIELTNEHYKRLSEGRFSSEESKKIYQEARAKDEIEKIKEQNKRKEELAQKAKDEADKRKKEREDLENENDKKRLQKIKDDAQKAYEINQEAQDILAESKKAKEEELEEENKKEEEQAEFKTSLMIDSYDEQKAIDISNFNNKKSQKEALESLGNSAIAGAKDLFAKNKGVQKGIVAAEGALALGKLAVNTVDAVSKDNAISPTTLGMPWSGIHIGMGVLGAASIISNTNKQLQALGGGSISGGGSQNIVSGSATTQASPQVAFNNTAENQIGRSIANAQVEQPPLQVVILESDVTKAQNNVKVLENKNSL
jgi:hypothetical protein